MIDNFALALPHALLAYALWRMLQRADLDSEDQAGEDQSSRPRQPEGPRSRA